MQCLIVEYGEEILKVSGPGFLIFFFFFWMEETLDCLKVNGCSSFV